ncbi:metallophosphoesterase family protein [Corynebacterium sp.]|uniref:metallophosphoesterase family protein n=1 Tax=Corynebacterium sp. TaxID=1720 RepID=UPI002A918A6C|nr:metallophosphoesterase family protein [Corynebacterium sp.]MDY5785094.1 metallophosphoesterase family protein [Corynebacterium sp.]
MLSKAAQHGAALSALVAFVLASADLAAPSAFAADSPIYRATVGVGADAASANISWRSRNRGPEVVRLIPVDRPDQSREIEGRVADFGARSYLSKVAEVTGLQPGTTYRYQIGSDEKGWSEPEHFTVDDGDGTWEAIAIADAQIGVGARVSEQAATWRATAEAAQRRAPDAAVFFSLGDQVEGWGNLVGPRGQYDGFFSAPQLRRFRVATIEGNHEKRPTSWARRHYKEHWILPHELGETSHYYFEQDNALVIGLNSNRNDEAGLAEQAQFVRDTVAAHGTDKAWVIVTNHFAFHSQGGRFSTPEIQRMRETLSPVFSEVGVDLVLSGHDHMYNRSHLVNGLAPTVPNTPAAPGDVLTQREGEVLYLTLSTAGGGKFYDFTGRDGHSYPGMTLKRARELNLHEDTVAFWNQDYTPDYSVIRVSPEAITVRTSNAADDSLVDAITLTRAGRTAAFHPASAPTRHP